MLASTNDNTDKSSLHLPLSEAPPMRVTIKTHPRSRSATLTYQYTLPPYTTSLLFLLALFTRRLSLEGPFSSLSCTRHAAINSANDITEDNDCTLIKSLPHRREFLFELATVRLRATARGSTRWFEVGLPAVPKPPGYNNAAPDLHELKGVQVSAHISNRWGESHEHVRIVKLGVASSVALGVESRGEVFGRGSRCGVQLVSNEGRVYELIEERGKKGCEDSARAAGLVGSYLRKAAARPGEKLHLDLTSDDGGLRSLIYTTSLAVFLASLLMTGWEEVTVDADSGTLKVESGGSLYKSGAWPCRYRTSSRVCSLENLASCRVSRRAVITPGGKGGVKAGGIKTHQLVLQLAGMGVEAMRPGGCCIDWRRGGSAAGTTELDLDFGSAHPDHSLLSEAASAVNDVIRQNGGDPLLDDFDTQDPESCTADALPEMSKMAGLSTTSPARRPGIMSDLSGLCVVCMSRRSNCVFKPCRHMRCCSGCAERLAQCPICRVEIKEREFVYV